MAACIFRRAFQPLSGSSHVLQQHTLHKSAILKTVHRSAWYRSFFQSEQKSQPKSTPDDQKTSDALSIKPKQPPNVFLLYMIKVQDSIKKEKPNANRRDIVNEASRRWKELNPEEKSKLALERKEMFIKFKEEKRIYEENMSPEQIMMDQKEREKKEFKKLKKARKSLGMPERPWTSYKWFMSEKFAERANEDIQTYFKQAKDMWMRLTPEEKEVYRDKHRQAQAQYQADMRQWEEVMIEDGRFDVVRKGTLAKLKQHTKGKNVP